MVHAELMAIQTEVAYRVVSGMLYLYSFIYQGPTLLYIILDVFLS